MSIAALLAAVIFLTASDPEILNRTGAGTFHRPVQQFGRRLRWHLPRPQSVQRGVHGPYQQPKKVLT